MNDLRPTLFLAQLSNLMAGNISIVHGVTGSSRTFMGEELAGVDAVRIALARIAAGQSDLALVGGAYNAERWEVVLHYVLGHAASRTTSTRMCGIGPRQVAAWSLARWALFWCWKRNSHALARGAKPFARLAGRCVRITSAARRAP